MNGNRLATESSLYLRQHAQNPVDWYPWGPEALQAARAQQKPIFLSVGYSACHWCHVMEHECFENPTIAKLMNEGFICIKVDREERPDLDQIYMNAHHLLNRGEGGGWPLSVFLTPELLPFYAGTYFPPDNRYEPHRPSFPRLLAAIQNAWNTRRAEFSELGQNIAGYLSTLGESEHSDKPLSLEILHASWPKLKRIYDPVHGGFGSAPKFPHPMELKLLLRLHQRSAEPEALAIVRHTLEKMARGGLYDQIGGGFHRYSVDAYWLVPHFEKMLYDNALLPPVYLEAWQLTQDPFYQQIACETLDYVLREMTSPHGAFYSTQDADSEGEEGKFYVWTQQELHEVLGAELGEMACRIFGVNEHGNFEGHNVLFRARSDEQESVRLGISQTDYSNALSSIKQKLYARRAQRVWPGRDEKILTAWNGLMITAFAQAGAVFHKPNYIQAAERAAEFIQARLRTPEGRLLRTCGEATAAKIPGFLEDYAYLAEGLLHLWEATYETKWLTWARELADLMIQHFAIPSGGFYYTADDAEPLITRSKDHHDGSTPSGNAVAAIVLAKLASLSGNHHYRLVAERSLQAASEAMRDNPAASGQHLISLDYFLGPISEVVVVGPRSSPEVEAVLRYFRQQFQPRRLLIWSDGMESQIPLAKGKQFFAPVTTYLCENNACQPPIIGVEAIAKS